MVNTGESYPHPELQTRVEELFEDAFLTEEEMHESSLFLNLKSVRMLQPSFPDMEEWQFNAPIFREQHPVRESMVSKLISRLIDLIPEESSNDPSISFSPTFTTRHRAVRGNPQGADPWASLHVSETSHEGSITVNGEVFDFDANQPIIEASSNWLNEDGRQLASGVGFTYVPHRDFITTNFSRETTHAFPYLDKEATPHENLSSIVEAAFQIER